MPKLTEYRYCTRLADVATDVRAAQRLRYIAFGMGGELLQNVNRDTMEFAMKASAICVDGTWRDVYKDPVTDSKKVSKRGRLALVRDGESYDTVRDDGVSDDDNILEPVFRDGQLLRDDSFEAIRSRVMS